MVDPDSPLKSSNPAQESPSLGPKMPTQQDSFDALADERTNSFVTDPLLTRYIRKKEAEYEVIRDEQRASLEREKAKWELKEATGEIKSGSAKNYLSVAGPPKERAERLFRAGEYADGDPFQGPTAPEPPIHEGVLQLGATKGPLESELALKGESAEYVKFYRGNIRISPTAGDPGNERQVCEKGMPGRSQGGYARNAREEEAR